MKERSKCCCRSSWQPQWHAVSASVSVSKQAWLANGFCFKITPGVFDEVEFRDRGCQKDRVGFQARDFFTSGPALFPVRCIPAGGHCVDRHPEPPKAPVSASPKKALSSPPGLNSDSGQQRTHRNPGLAGPSITGGQTGFDTTPTPKTRSAVELRNVGGGGVLCVLRCTATLTLLCFTMTRPLSIAADGK